MNKRKATAFLLAVILCLVGIAVHLSDARMQREEQCINACADIFENEIYEAIALNASPLRRETQATEDVARLFSRQKQLESISVLDAQTIRFVFDWSSFAPEKHAELLYAQNDRLALALFLPDRNEWVLEEENSFLLSGLGVNGQGYISVKRIMPCWFDVETYFPT